MLTLPAGYSAIPEGHLATVVTTLEMRAPPDGFSATDSSSGHEVTRVERPSLDWYRAMFRAVGEDWLWTSRLRLGDIALSAIIHDPAVEIFSLRRAGSDIGLLELDFRIGDACELAFFGVTRDAIGTGAAHAMMRHALARAWAAPIRRFWVHTCTLDHPRAVRFYMRAGFRPIKYEVDVFPDPRREGLVARDAAPHAPMID